MNILSSSAPIYGCYTPNLSENGIIEKDIAVFHRLQDHIEYILNNENYIIRKGQELFINPTIDEGPIDTVGERKERLSKYVFVAMPYKKALNNVYNYGIKGTLEKRNLISERLDKDQFTGDIIERIKNRITNAAFLIADLTDASSNVFYEVGYADGLKKQIILLSQRNDLPFDLYTHKCIFYDPEDIALLEETLGNNVNALLEPNSG